MDDAEFCRKVVSGRKVACSISFLVNIRELQLECARVLQEALVMPVLVYGNQTMIWKERSRIKAVQVDNLRGFLGIRKLCGVIKG